MSDANNMQPPRWPLKLLRLLVKDNYIEEIEGDMEEAFQDDLEQFSPAKARRRYAIETLKLVHPILIKNMSAIDQPTPFPMLRNYFKTSFRSLMKNPLTSFINVFGLSAAIGICLLVYTFLAYDRAIDQFHENKDNVFLVTFNADFDGTSQRYGITPRPLGEVLKQDFAEVKNVCHVEDKAVVVKQGVNVFHESVRMTDPEFLDMFTFPMKWGSANSLKDLNSIILSHDMSVKYFGTENPVGRDILLIFGDENKKEFTVTGVAKQFPKSHDIAFGFLINYKNASVADPAYDYHDWKSAIAATFIQVDNPSVVTIINNGMEKYRKVQNEVRPDWAISSFGFEPLSTLYRNSSNIKKCISQDANLEGRIGMPIIAIFMLTLACFNYINIAIVSAAKRLKEIGVRKVIGANRIRVVIQFLTENIVVTFFALLVGALLGIFIFIPWFTAFTGWPLEAKLWDVNIWLFLLALLLFTGIASGIYPAFYISKFDAIRIFKGSLEFGRKNPLTKVFLGIQLVLACITITAGVVFTQNNAYQRTRSWGYNQRDVLYVEVPDQPAFDKMKSAISQSANVIAVSGSKNHLGKNSSTLAIRGAMNKNYEVSQIAVDAQYFETMQLELKQGRLFKTFSENDKHTIIVNETFVQNLALAEPIGKQFKIDSINYEIIGIVKDFHAESFFNKIKPTLFTVAEEKDYRYLSFRIKHGTDQESHAYLMNTWARLYPEIPFQGGYQEDTWSGYFYSLDKSVSFNSIIACVAVMLASLGLYGLVTLNVSGRVREFSIRKTLGAGLKNITSIIMKQYWLLVTIALIIGAPISYIFTQAYLDMLFSYSMPIGYSGIIISLLILVGILFLVISTQIRKVSKSNPLEGLKAE